MVCDLHCAMALKLIKFYLMREGEVERRSENKTDKTDFYIFGAMFYCRGYLLPRFFHLPWLQKPHVSAFERPFSRKRAE